jgi:hypothetical protein
MSLVTNNKSVKYVAFASCAVAVLGVSRMAQASIDYGNFFGPNVEYEQVTESSATNPLPLYGPPTVIANSITFSPPDFSAMSTNGGAPDITDGHLNTTIVGLGSTTLDQLDFSDAGDYTLEGSGTSATSTSVAAPVILRVTALNGVAVNPIEFTANLTFTPTGGTFTLPGSAGTGVLWNGTLDFNLDSALAGAGYSGQATSVIVDLDNTLTAFSQTGTVAFIEKKAFDGVTITPVPEPTCLGLLTLGGCSLLARRRRA